MLHTNFSICLLFLSLAQDIMHFAINYSGVYIIKYYKCKICNKSAL